LLNFDKSLDVTFSDVNVIDCSLSIGSSVVATSTG